MDSRKVHSILERPYDVCRVAANGRNGYKKQHSWISNGLKTIRNNESLLSKFKTIVLP